MNSTSRRFSSGAYALWLVAAFCVAALCACGGDTTVASSSADAGAMPAADGGGPGSGGHHAITADWLNKSLTILDLDKLEAGAKRKDVVVATIDLSKYSPGPMEVAVTPDGKTALVSISAGFFTIPGSAFLVNASSIPADPGTLLMVDLSARKVVAELDTGKSPMGILITPDGTKAFVTNFGSAAIAIIDVVHRKLSGHVTVGQLSEELALDDTGTVGIFSYSAAANVRTFDPADIAGTLSPDVALQGDSAGVAFFPGTKIAYVVDAPNPIINAVGGHNVVDVTNPKAPVVLENVRDASAPISYPAVPFAARKSVIVPAVVNGMLQLLEYRLANKKAELASTTDVTKVTLFGAFHTTIDPQGRVLCAVPREHLLTVTDLTTKKSFSIDWGGTQPGPTDIQVIP